VTVKSGAKKMTEEAEVVTDTQDSGGQETAWSYMHETERPLPDDPDVVTVEALCPGPSGQN
jgi:hypothetical protein